MTFNRGFMCKNCGPIEKAKSKQITKVKHNVCPNCSEIVTEWERPLNERAGHCGNCVGASFTLAIVKGQLLRCCKTCKEVYNTDRGEIVREGSKEYEYKNQTI
jgi:hypothetical protein